MNALFQCSLLFLIACCVTLIEGDYLGNEFKNEEELLTGDDEEFHSGVSEEDRVRRALKGNSKSNIKQPNFQANSKSGTHIVYVKQRRRNHIITCCGRKSCSKGSGNSGSRTTGGNFFRPTSRPNPTYPTLYFHTTTRKYASEAAMLSKALNSFLSPTTDPNAISLVELGGRSYHIDPAEKLNFFDSLTYCRKNGMSLASIGTKDENNAVSSLLSSLGLGSAPVLTSANKINTPASPFSWLDGGAMDFGAMAMAGLEALGGMPPADTLASMGDCLLMDGGQLKDASCTEANNFMCEQIGDTLVTPVPTYATTVSQDAQMLQNALNSVVSGAALDPSLFSQVNLGGRNYHIDPAQKMNYFDALTFCRNNGMDLASVSSKPESSLISSMLSSLGLGSAPVLTSANKINTPSSPFSWLDGGAMDFGAMAMAGLSALGGVSSVPASTLDTMGNCLTMNSGQLADANCMTASNFMCEQTGASSSLISSVGVGIATAVPSIITTLHSSNVINQISSMAQPTLAVTTAPVVVTTAVVTTVAPTVVTTLAVTIVQVVVTTAAITTVAPAVVTTLAVTTAPVVVTTAAITTVAPAVVTTLAVTTAPVVVTTAVVTTVAPAVVTTLAVTTAPVVVTTVAVTTVAPAVVTTLAVTTAPITTTTVAGPTTTLPCTKVKCNITRCLEDEKLLAKIMAVAPSTTQTPSKLTLVSLNNKKYYIHSQDNDKNFFDALTFCRNNGMDMLTIETKDENDAIIKQIGNLNRSDHAWWISATKIGHECPYTWLNDANMTFDGLGPGEPTDFNSTNCLAIKGTNWSSRNCQDKKTLMCEVN